MVHNWFSGTQWAVRQGVCQAWAGGVGLTENVLDVETETGEGGRLRVSQGHFVLCKL